MGDWFVMNTESKEIYSLQNWFTCSGILRSLEKGKNKSHIFHDASKEDNKVVDTWQIW